MLRYLFLIFLLWLGAEVSGQGVIVPKSTDIIVIRGKSYYLHTVEAGQTLYSICRAYEVDVEEVKKLNEKKDSNLSLYEVLKIPYTEPFVRQDGKYYYHRVAMGETLYSISRMYDIKPKRLLKFNTQYSHNEPLAIGAVVRLPLDEIKLPDGGAAQVEKVEIRQSPEEVAEVQTIKKATETYITLEVPGTEKDQPVKDTLPVSAREMPDYISEVVLPGDPFVKVALLLPFSAQDYPGFPDSTGIYGPVSISSRSEQFVHFYEGILLAVDSLKQEGLKIDLHVFDTERSSNKMYVVADEINRLKPDLIIGPVYGSVYKVMAGNLQHKGIPMVYPLSSRSENFGEYPNFIQVNASQGVLAAKMKEWLAAKTGEANIVCIDLQGGDLTDPAEGAWLHTEILQVEGAGHFGWNMDEVPLDSLRTLLLPDRENILVLPAAREADVSKVLPLLSALTDGYKITVVGLPEWQTFTSVDHETYYKLNTKIFTYSFVDYHAPEVRLLTEKYRKYFYSEPVSLVFKAFDIGMYFIGLAAKYRDRTLDALEYDDRITGVSRFRFAKMANGLGKENEGFFIVNFSSDYQLKIEAL